MNLSDLILNQPNPHQPIQRQRQQQTSNSQTNNFNVGAPFSFSGSISENTMLPNDGRSFEGATRGNHDVGSKNIGDRGSDGNGSGNGVGESARGLGGVGDVRGRRKRKRPCIQEPEIQESSSLTDGSREEEEQQGQQQRATIPTATTTIPNKNNNSRNNSTTINSSKPPTTTTSKKRSKEGEAGTGRRKKKASNLVPSGAAAAAASGTSGGQETGTGASVANGDVNGNGEGGKLRPCVPCRIRRVKCVRSTPTSPICVKCIAKNIPCTLPEPSRPKGARITQPNSVIDKIRSGGIGFLDAVSGQAVGAKDNTRGGGREMVESISAEGTDGLGGLPASSLESGRGSCRSASGSSPGKSPASPSNNNTNNNNDNAFPSSSNGGIDGRSQSHLQSMSLSPTSLSSMLSRTADTGALMLELIDEFFIHEVNQCPFLDWSEFRMKFHLSGRRPCQMSDQEQALCAAIVAYGARTSSSPLLFGITGTGTGLGVGKDIPTSRRDTMTDRGRGWIGTGLEPTGRGRIRIGKIGGKEADYDDLSEWGVARELACRYLANRASDIVDEKKTLRSPCLESVATLSLLSSCVDRDDPIERRRARLFHRSLAEHLKITNEEYLSHNKSWDDVIISSWWIYSIDCLAACHCGWSPSFNRDDFEVLCRPPEQSFTEIIGVISCIDWSVLSLDSSTRTKFAWTTVTVFLREFSELCLEMWRQFRSARALSRPLCETNVMDMWRRLKKINDCFSTFEIAMHHLGPLLFKAKGLGRSVSEGSGSGAWLDSSSMAAAMDMGGEGQTKALNYLVLFRSFWVWLFLIFRRSLKMRWDLDPKPCEPDHTKDINKFITGLGAIRSTSTADDNSKAPAQGRSDGSKCKDPSCLDRPVCRSGDGKWAEGILEETDRLKYLAAREAAVVFRELCELGLGLGQFPGSLLLSQLLPDLCTSLIETPIVPVRPGEAPRKDGSLPTAEKKVEEINWVLEGLNLLSWAWGDSHIPQIRAWLKSERDLFVVSNAFYSGTS